MAAPSRQGMLGGVQGAGPSQVQPRQLKKYVFSTGEVPIEQTLPYIIVVNADTVAHTITAKSVIQSDSDIPFNLPIGGVLPIPTLPFKSLSVDGGGSSANVYAFYSDVHLSPGPSSGAGSAASVANNFNETITPNANATEQMAGLGSTLRITPLRSGNVLLIFTVQLIPGAGDSCLVTARFGTGTAPVLNAAATGTLVSSAVVDSFGLAAANLDNYFAGAVLITGLVVGTSYWIDLGVRVTAFASDSVFLVRASISEMPT